MHSGHYLFTQLTMFLPQRYFRRLVDKYEDRTRNWSFSHWNHLLVLMFGQLIGCSSLRELTDITVAHGKRSYHLGFGKNPITRNALSKANSVRDYRIFEEFAFHMVSLAQKRRITRGFELHGRFYAVDSTTIDLCMSMFEWAHFRSTKSGVRIHTHRLISSRRYLSSTELRPPRYMIPKLWTGLHTSHWLAMSLTGATLTLPGSSPLNNTRPSSLSGRKASLTMRSSVEKTSLMERIMSSETRLSVLQERGTRTTIRQSSAGLSTMLRNFSGRSHTIQTTSILKPMTSLFCTDTDGRWSCSLNGLSSISRLNLFGALLRMLSESRYMSLSLHSVSLLLWNMISNWADRWLKSCVSWVVHCLSRIPSRSSSNLWLESRLMATSSSSVLNLHTINIY